ncbi:tetratricopeptide repeat protein [Methylotetracoccus oryzae]|uniref:tetratricopeptide repeat protein n=1 Tax=Methylotetracoccus oryzae TaxID=1919059 RepID=UPI0013A55528|nr:FecR domain-containing protein [Methylotetracoccus oryzae]
MRTFLWPSLAAVLLTSLESRADETCAPVGRLASVEGSVEIAHADESSWQVGRLDERLCEGDSVRVGESSRAAVQLINDAVLRLDQSTTIRLLDITAKKEERSLLQLVAGALKSFSRSPRHMAVNTPYVNGMIEGTEFAMRVDGEQTEVTVFEGKVSAVNSHGKLALTPGQSAVAARGAAPRAYTLVKPQDAVQWTLYYPPIFSFAEGSGEAHPPAESDALKRIIASAARGDTVGALQLAASVAPSERTPRFDATHAALLLQIGRVDEARGAIDAALRRDPKSGLAYALRSVIAVVQNQRESALQDARKAVALSRSAAAKIALSYVQQSAFEIPAARDTLLAAVREHPNDANAWARLAELQLMLENRSEATEAARKAEALAPNLSRTQMVLGFAALAEFRDREALQAFERAVRLDSADPMGHFGLGLTRIYRGDVPEGRSELEAAVALGSSNALLRAYLGKAYFEEKRHPLDEQQFRIAKELDPSDPTAYLYDGIQKQTVNRPIEALKDIQASIDKNDSRAVYRSRQLLDQDRAARGTTLSRVYKDLGVLQWGIREATKSLMLSPADASAHRFLSDSYLGIRRREIARVSELLQAQLLQDINIYPIQPSIAETNLNILTITGPSNPGFNEFTPLFERNQAKLYASGVAGNNNTYGGEGVVAAVYDRLSLSAGAYTYNSDGFRPNNGINQTIYDFFAQAAITNELNVQGELRRRNSTEGDLAFNFNPGNYLANQRITRDQDMARLGLRYSPTTHSHFLLSWIYSTLDFTDRQPNQPLDPFLSLNLKAVNRQPGNQYEAQYIHEFDWLNLVAGASYASASYNTDVDATFTDPSGTPLFSDSFSQRYPVQFPHGYVYLNAKTPQKVTWTTGFSYDDFEQGPIKETSINPKLGVQWQTTPDLLLRAAAFKTMKPVLVNNRTIEPTQIAGFNQLFDDINGTQSWRYGTGFNWRITPDFYLGGEATWRRIQEPQIFLDQNNSQSVLSEGRREQFHDLYLFWTITDQLIAKLEFVYDDYNAAQGIATEFDNLPTHVSTMSAPIGLTYYSPQGMFVGATGSFVDQTVQRSASSVDASGNDNFFLVDASIGYRFPKRYGLISFAVQNLMDTKFQYQDDSFREFRTEPVTGPYFPERTFLGRLVINF